MEQVSAQTAPRLQHHGRGGELFVIFVINVLLKLVTLGVYHFWAKTRVRRYLWTQASVDGEHLEYTGTGDELLLGFLKVVGLMVLLGIGAALLAINLPIVFFVVLGIGYVLSPVAVGAGLYGANRYKLTRTRLRGIRFGLEGSAWDYGMQFFGYSLLTILTLGLYTPFMRMKLARYTLGNTRFGNARFQFSGKGGDLFGAFFLTWLLTIPTLGLIWFWYGAREARYRVEHIRIEGVRFKLALSGRRLFWLMLSNLLLLVVTLGLAFPWVLCRNLRIVLERVSVDGALDYDRILQAQQVSSATGEGLVEALDLGVI